MIFDTIKHALINELGIEDDLISTESYVSKDLELDSTENVVISLELKKKYGVDFVFPKDDITLDDICKQVESMRTEIANT